MTEQQPEDLMQLVAESAFADRMDQYVKRDGWAAADQWGIHSVHEHAEPAYEDARKLLHLRWPVRIAQLYDPEWCRHYFAVYTMAEERRA